MRRARFAFLRIDHALSILLFSQERWSPLIIVVHAGCLIRVRPLGMLDMLEESKYDPKILAVPENRGELRSAKVGRAIWSRTNPLDQCDESANAGGTLPFLRTNARSSKTAADSERRRSFSTVFSTS